MEDDLNDNELIVSSVLIDSSYRYDSHFIEVQKKQKKLQEINGSIIYDVDEEIHPHLFFYKKIETYENSS